MLSLASVLCLAAAVPALAQDDPLKLLETRRVELNERERVLKSEEARLNVLRKEVDEKIAAYTKLLAEVDAAVRKVEQVKDEKLDSLVKAYEAMPPEDAAARLSALEKHTALQIMSRMKSKKAGAVIANMEPRKAAALTKSLASLPIRSKEL